MTLDRPIDAFSELLIPIQEESIAALRDERREHHSTLSLSATIVLMQRHERNLSKHRVLLIVLDRAERSQDGEHLPR